MNIGSELEFENATVPVDSGDSFTIVARSPGEWGNRISVAIANEGDFTSQETEAFPGVRLNDLFEFPATEDEIGIIVREGEDIKEVFLVSVNKFSKDINNKSNYIENVINRKSNLIFVKHLDGVLPASCLDEDVIYLDDGEETTPTAGDIAEAYELWENKEEVDIDIVICNEVDGGLGGFNLADSRKDCIAFMGTESNIVGKKAALANTEVLANRSAFGKNSMFACYGGNYKYQYDRYNDKNRWINVAGDIAGLRAATSSSRASWWASAGLERGQLKNVIKLAYNPNQAQRDALYKKNINPIVTFPGQGTVMWGQKTLLDKASSFDRVNVRGLFNTLERALSKMAKYQVMEFNDNFTRNRIVSMIKPFLSTVQAGRGVQDFLVICDSTNNTADIISRNQLIVDVYIKPTYVAEFILLRFTNAGTNSFSEIVGG